ncbi:MAG TPA: tripartite tricarboxylate transporter substrate binding protein [Pseudolabrys sp.]|nr:tripartite tricarboxylate transporter substrate binding protein [Pseudolabrys sp.]
MLRLTQLLILTHVLFGVALADAHAATFPDHTVRLIIPYSAGGGLDTLGRPLADRLSKLWHQPVIVENKTGASTIIGTESVARSPKDGHTLLLTSDLTITSNPFLFKNLPYDPLKDLVPVTELVSHHQMIVVNPSVQANSMAELIAYAKAHPTALTYGSYGRASPPNLLFETMKAKTGATFLDVQYRGVAPAILAVLQGSVQITMGGAATTGQYIKAGKMKALAIGRPDRLKDFPDVPTLSELGLGYADPKTWFGLFAPAGTPSDIVSKIQSDVAAVMNDPEFKERYIDSVGYTGVAGSSADFGALIRRDLEEKKEMIEAAGIKPE